MKIIPKVELINARKEVAARQAQLDALIALLSKVNDIEKVSVILALAKSLAEPTVAEGALYASSVLNGKGIHLRSVAKDFYVDGNFGILPSAVLVGA